MMIVDYDPLVKAAYIGLSGHKKIAKSLRVSPDIVLDLGPNNELIGIELLHVEIRTKSLSS